MSDRKQPAPQPVAAASVQQAAEHLRVDFAKTGAFKPQDLRLVFGDIRSSVVVAAVDPAAAFKKD